MRNGGQLVVWLMELAMGGLVLCFCLVWLFGRKGEPLLGDFAGTVQEEAGEEETVHDTLLQQLANEVTPRGKLRGDQISVGEEIALWDYVEVQLADGSWCPCSRQREVTSQLLAFYDTDGRKLSPELWKAGQEQEEISTSLGYDTTTGKLIFYRSGSYQAAVELTGEYGARSQVLLTFLAEAD